MKPILFNTEMVRAILYGRKTCTWRVIKPQPEHVHTIFGPSEEKDRTFEFMCGYIRDGVCYDWIEAVTMPCQPGDVLYVRETWRVRDCIGDYAKGTKRVEIEYRAGSDSHIIYPTGPDFDKWRQGAKWHPSIHMPKEAARIFLRVTNVRAERLQDISPIGIRMEGIQSQRIDEWDCNDCIARYDGCIIRLKKLAADRLEQLSNQHIKVQYRSEELTISEMCGRMDDLREENELLRDALAEMNETSDRTSRDERIMRQAIETYGVQAQCDVAIEEMAELTKAIMKIRRVADDYEKTPAALDNLLEEIADVEIMIDQLKIMYGERYVNAVREQKLVRLEGQLNEQSTETEVTP